MPAGASARVMSSPFERVVLTLWILRRAVGGSSSSPRVTAEFSMPRMIIQYTEVVYVLGGACIEMTKFTPK